MNRTLTITVMSVLMMIGMIRFGFAGSTNSEKRIVIHIRNYTHIDSADLRRASEIAADIFKKAGIEAIVAGPHADTGLTQGMESSRFCQFQVNILSPEMARRVGLPMSVLGVAPGSRHDDNRTTVYIFGDVAEAIGNRQNTAARHEILGHAIAHEIGHVLLNMTAHSESGIMVGTWKGRDFQAMTMGNLTFGPEQVAGIRTEVARRYQQRAR
jgi:hypothetical protein